MKLLYNKIVFITCNIMHNVVNIILLDALSIGINFISGFSFGCRLSVSHIAMQFLSSGLDSYSFVSGVFMMSSFLHGFLPPPYS